MSGKGISRLGRRGQQDSRARHSKNMARLSDWWDNVFALSAPRAGRGAVDASSFFLSTPRPPLLASSPEESLGALGPSSSTFTLGGRGPRNVTSFSTFFASRNGGPSSSAVEERTAEFEERVGRGLVGLVSSKKRRTLLRTGFTEDGADAAANAGMADAGSDGKDGKKENKQIVRWLHTEGYPKVKVANSPAQFTLPDIADPNMVCDPSSARAPDIASTHPTIQLEKGWVDSNPDFKSQLYWYHVKIQQTSPDPGKGAKGVKLDAYYPVGAFGEQDLSASFPATGGRVKFRDPSISDFFWFQLAVYFTLALRQWCAQPPTDAGRRRPGPVLDMI